MDPTTIIYIILIITLIYLVYDFIFDDTEHMDNNDEEHNEEHDHHNHTSDEYSYVTDDKSYAIKSKDIYYPETLKEMVEIIKDNSGRKIRVSGGHHTFNTISISPDITIRTTKLIKILKLNKKKKQVTVQSGIRLLELTNYLQKKNLALTILPAIPFQTIGGAISTSTHGSTSLFGSMSSMVVDVTMVLGNGNVIKIDEKSPYFEAATTSLGCLGAVYSITLQCEDLFAVRHREVKMTLEEVFSNYQNLRDEYEFLQIYIYPYTPNMTCILYLRKKTNTDNIRSKLENNTASNKIDYYHKILTKNREGESYTEMEIGVPEKYIKDAIHDTIDLYLEYKDKYGYDTKYPISIRFTRADKNSLLSMVSDRDTVFVDVFNRADRHSDPILNKLFKEIHDRFISKYKGRPHYGKKHYLTENQMIEIYGKNKIRRFNKIKKKLDPNNMFSNSYINNLL